MSLTPDWFFSGLQARQFRFNRRLIAWPIIQKVVLVPNHQTVNAVSTEMRFISMTRIQAVSWMLRQFKFWLKPSVPGYPFERRLSGSVSALDVVISRSTQLGPCGLRVTTFWTVRLRPCRWFCRRKSCRYIFINSNRNTMGWNAVVFSTCESTLLCYIVFHPARSAHKFHFQPLKLSMKPAVAVT
jgi:hypothetical protein